MNTTGCVGLKGANCRQMQKIASHIRKVHNQKVASGPPDHLYSYYKRFL